MRFPGLVCALFLFPALAVAQDFPREQGVYLGTTDGAWIRLERLDPPYRLFCHRDPPEPVPTGGFLDVVRYWALGGPQGRRRHPGRHHRVLGREAFNALPAVVAEEVEAIFIRSPSETLSFLEGLTTPEVFFSTFPRPGPEDARRLYDTTGLGPCDDAAMPEVFASAELMSGVVGSDCGAREHDFRFTLRMPDHREYFRIPQHPRDPLRARVTARFGTCGMPQGQSAPSLGAALHTSEGVYGYRYVGSVLP